MSPVRLRRDQCCLVPACLRPAREHGHCTRCYQALTSLERRTLTWEAETIAAARDLIADRDPLDVRSALERMRDDLAAFDAGQQPTEELGTARVAEVVLLEGWMDLPAWDEAA